VAELKNEAAGQQRIQGAIRQTIFQGQQEHRTTIRLVRIEEPAFVACQPVVVGSRRTSTRTQGLDAMRSISVRCRQKMSYLMLRLVTEDVTVLGLTDLEHLGLRNEKLLRKGQIAICTNNTNNTNNFSNDERK
jgi:hypothetical protein